MRFVSSPLALYCYSGLRVLTIYIHIYMYTRDKTRTEVNNIFVQLKLQGKSEGETSAQTRVRAHHPLMAIGYHFFLLLNAIKLRVL